MEYSKVVDGYFLSRPNRFIAVCEIDGQEEVCHVKNTGRCKEILVPGAESYLELSNNPARKTKYSLVTVRKGDKLINIDSQAPNKIVREWIEGGGLFTDLAVLRSEYAYGNSRFDFFAEADGYKHLIEVKGVTLENEGIFSFPDAPTERGTKHLKELTSALDDGYKCHVVFVIQADYASGLIANRDHDPQFADALKTAFKSGVQIHTLTCKVERNHVSPLSDAAIFIPEK